MNDIIIYIYTFINLNTILFFNYLKLFNNLIFLLDFLDF